MNRTVEEIKAMFSEDFPGKGEEYFRVYLKGFQRSDSKGGAQALFLVSGEKAGPDKILDYLNEARKKISRNKNASGFRMNDSVKRTIGARIKEGYTEEDFRAVIDWKCKEWKGTAFEQYIRPSTLFSPKHFSEYLCEAESRQRKPQSSIESGINSLMEG